MRSAPPLEKRRESIAVRYVTRFNGSTEAKSWPRLLGPYCERESTNLNITSGFRDRTSRWCEEGDDGRDPLKLRRRIATTRFPQHKGIIAARKTLPSGFV